jgi:hypothetical protein
MIKTFFKKFWKEITITSIIVLVVGISKYAFGADATNQTTVNYPDFIDASKTTSPASFVSGFYTYALSISGTLAVIMIVYGGVKYTISAGNASAQSDAKNIITSSIWGVILLAGAYIILNTINPQLLNLSAFEQTASGTLGPIATSTYNEPGTGNGNSDLAAIAAQLASIPIVDFWNNNHCGQGTQSDIIVPGSDPASNISYVKDSNLPVICSSDCQQCIPGGRSGNITLSKNMLQGLVNTFNFFFNSLGNHNRVLITALTGGKHSGVTGGGHYDGKAVDIQPYDNDSYEWSSYVNALMNYGKAFTAFCEYPPGHPTDCINAFTNGNRNPGAHIHAQW